MCAARAVSEVAPLALAAASAAADSSGRYVISVATNVSYAQGVRLLNVTLVDTTNGTTSAMNAVQVANPNLQTINGEWQQLL